MALRRQALQGMVALAMAKALRWFFRRQAAAAAARFNAVPLEERAGLSAWYGTAQDVETKAVGPEQIIPQADAEILIRVLLPHITRQTLESAAIAAGLVGVPALEDTSNALFRLLNESGTRIVRINDMTREAVRRALTDGRALGESNFQLAKRLRLIVEEAYTGRAETIARTETAVADQRAAHDRYTAAGVQFVDVFDGPDCGWTSHDDPDHANGSRRTLAEAEAHPTAHPNCVRVSLPVIE